MTKFWWKNHYLGDDKHLQGIGRSKDGPWTKQAKHGLATECYYHLISVLLPKKVCCNLYVKILFPTHFLFILWSSKIQSRPWEGLKFSDLEEFTLVHTLYWPLCSTTNISFSFKSFVSLPRIKIILCVEEYFGSTKVK